MATKNITPKDPTTDEAKVDGDAEATEDAAKAAEAQDRKASCIKFHP